MATSTFVLGWKKTILGNVTLVGRPFSSVSLTKGYDKDAVAGQLLYSVICARQMVTKTRALVLAGERDALLTSLDMGDMSTTKSEVFAVAGNHLAMPNTLTKGNSADWLRLFKHLKQVFLLIGQGICGNLILVDVPSVDKADGTKGQVGFSNATPLDDADPNGLRIADRGRIHINFQWCTTRTPQRVGRTIIHEASHKFCGTRDHAYKWDTAAYQGLTEAEAWSNADSIACFAYYCWKSGVYKVDQSRDD